MVAAKGKLLLAHHKWFENTRRDGNARDMMGCPAYMRVLQWLFAQPSWRAAPDRHVFVFPNSQVRCARARAAQALPCT